MSLKEQLHEIASYYQINRRAGHTTTMVKGVKNVPISIVLTHRHDFGKHIKEMAEGNNVEIVTINSLDHLRGKHYPLVIDNAVQESLFFRAAEQIDKLEKENKRIRD